jgi:hypothetical protein
MLLLTTIGSLLLLLAGAAALCDRFGPAEPCYAEPAGCPALVPAPSLCTRPAPTGCRLTGSGP